MVLEKVDSPDDVKKLSELELAVLANDLRKKILETVSATGGHVAPNLGTVELTIALHRCFESPRDRIIWDVGHQAYAHKLLTGRKERFHTIRQYKGLSGYPRIEESEHDFFGVGHASTSLSASLGMAVARDKRGEKYHVIAVIGDGALTGGMAMEGLNQIGFLQKDLIVVLNDNQMSISPNVGAMGAYTNRLVNKIVSTPLFHEVRGDIHLLLDNLPPERQDLRDAVKRLRKNALMVATEGIVFQELGFTYVGPVDGHDFKALIPALEKAKTIKGPVLVHVNTIKGKGYQHAEEKPTSFHGAGPFDLATGKPKKQSALPSYSKVFSQAVTELAEKDERIIAITAAMPDGTGLTVFRERFPNRFFDVGIAEQHAITFAAGLASNGLRPVAAIYSTFLQRAFDQLVHDVCLQNLPVVVGVDRAGVVGDDGPTHHGCFDVSYLRLMPNMAVMAPKDGNELRDMVKTALEREGPSAIRYPRAAVPEQPSTEMHSLEIGKAEVLREGGDVTVVALGSMVSPAVEAAEKLAGKGIECTVVNARFAKPLDEELVKKKCRETGRLLVVEENCVRGGLGAGILKTLELDNIDVKAKVLAIPDYFIEHGSIPQLKKEMGLDVEGITAAVESITK